MANELPRLMLTNPELNLPITAYSERDPSPSQCVGQLDPPTPPPEPELEPSPAIAVSPTYLSPMPPPPPYYHITPPPFLQFGPAPFIPVAASYFSVWSPNAPYDFLPEFRVDPVALSVHTPTLTLSPHGTGNYQGFRLNPSAQEFVTRERFNLNPNAQEFVCKGDLKPTSYNDDQDTIRKTMWLYAGEVAKRCKKECAQLTEDGKCKCQSFSDRVQSGIELVSGNTLTEEKYKKQQKKLISNMLALLDYFIGAHGDICPPSHFDLGCCEIKLLRAFTTGKFWTERALFGDILMTQYGGKER